MKIRMYDLQHKDLGSIGLELMEHKEACTMKARLLKPSDWILVQVN